MPNQPLTTQNYGIPAGPTAYGNLPPSLLSNLLLANPYDSDVKKLLMSSLGTQAQSNPLSSAFSAINGVYANQQNKEQQDVLRHQQQIMDSITSQVPDFHSRSDAEKSTILQNLQTGQDPYNGIGGGKNDAFFVGGIGSLLGNVGRSTQPERDVIGKGLNATVAGLSSYVGDAGKIAAQLAANSTGDRNLHGDPFANLSNPLENSALAIQGNPYQSLGDVASGGQDLGNLNIVKQGANFYGDQAFNPLSYIPVGKAGELAGGAANLAKTAAVGADNGAMIARMLTNPDFLSQLSRMSADTAGTGAADLAKTAGTSAMSTAQPTIQDLLSQGAIKSAHPEDVYSSLNNLLSHPSPDQFGNILRDASGNIANVAPDLGLSSIQAGRGNLDTITKALNGNTGDLAKTLGQTTSNQLLDTAGKTAEDLASPVIKKQNMLDAFGTAKSEPSAAVKMFLNANKGIPTELAKNPDVVSSLNKLMNLGIFKSGGALADTTSNLMNIIDNNIIQPTIAAAKPVNVGGLEGILRDSLTGKGLSADFINKKIGDITSEVQGDINKLGQGMTMEPQTLMSNIQAQRQGAWQVLSNPNAAPKALAVAHAQEDLYKFLENKVANSAGDIMMNPDTIDKIRAVSPQLANAFESKAGDLTLRDVINAKQPLFVGNQIGKNSIQTTLENTAKPISGYGPLGLINKALQDTIGRPGVQMAGARAANSLPNAAGSIMDLIKGAGSGAAAGINKAGDIAGNLAGGAADMIPQPVKDALAKAGNLPLSTGNLLTNSVQPAYAAQNPVDNNSSMISSLLSGNQNGNSDKNSPDSNNSNNDYRTAINQVLTSNKTNHTTYFNQLVRMGKSASESKTIADEQYPTLNKQDELNLRKVQNGMTILDKVESMYSNLGSMKGFGGGNITELLGNAGLDQQAKKYQDQLGTWAFDLASALSGSGNGGSNMKVKLDELSLPHIGDSPEVAKEKIANLRQQLQDNANNVLGLIGK